MGSGFYGIIAFVIGFSVAQVGKFLIMILRGGGKKYRTFGEFLSDVGRSGGMPSGHSASFAALSTVLGLFEGFSSAIFALSLGMTLIIIYDAVNVRYIVGEHGKLLNEIARTDKSEKTKPQKLVEGHTIPQAIAGILLGILVGSLVYLAAGMLAGVSY